MEIEVEWDELKVAVLSKPDNMQYVEFANSYTVVLIDGFFSCFCKITKEDPVVGGSDQEDFENNFKARGNGSVDKASPTDRYILHEIDESGTITYIGLIDAMGVWLIKKLVENGNDLTITYSNLSNNQTRTSFTIAWTDRAILTYDLVENLTGV